MNPVLSEKIFKKEAVEYSAGTMTAKGTAMKSLLLLIMVLSGASYTWKIF